MDFLKPDEYDGIPIYRFVVNLDLQQDWKGISVLTKMIKMSKMTKNDEKWQKYQLTKISTDKNDKIDKNNKIDKNSQYSQNWKNEKKYRRKTNLVILKAAPVDRYFGGR